METKKALQVSLAERKVTYWLTGLVGIMSFAFISFEYSGISRRSIITTGFYNEILEEELIPITQQKVEVPPAPEVIESFDVVEDDVLIEEFEMDTSEDLDTEVNIINLDQTGPSDEEEADSQEIVTFVEKQPAFPGGDAALMKFLSSHLKYPSFEAENGIQGRVTLTFVVEKDGSITDIDELRSPSAGLTKEAKRVVSSMPKWQPGKQHGKPVRVRFTLPVVFRLN